MPYTKECDQCGAKVDESWEHWRCPQDSCDGTLRWLSNVYRVWDERNETVNEARVFLADSAEEAAIQYAQEDVDGLIDGIYTHNGLPHHDLEKGGWPISVWDAQGRITRWKVGITEFEPVFGACEAKTQEV